MKELVELSKFIDRRLDMAGGYDKSNGDFE